VREQHYNSINRLVHKAFLMGKGAVVAYIEDDNVTYLECMEWTDVHRKVEGLSFGVAGTMDGEQRTWMFEAAELAKKNITRFMPHGHFMKNNQRWDFVEGTAITAETGPQGSNDPIVYIYVRNAVEINNTVQGDDFGFDLTVED
jgi:hypothetical protein